MRTVLVVEDDADVREMLELVLDTEGHRVLTAPNGAAALELLRTRAGEVALILLDLVMPVMDGWVFLERRRESPALKRIPTVIISAAQPFHALANEADAFLPKPVSTDRLVDLVARYVQDASS